MPPHAPPSLTRRAVPPPLAPAPVLNPRAQSLAEDLRVRGAPIVVYLHLLNELDPVHFRPVKQAVLALRLQLSERWIRQALNILVAQGYIEREREHPNETVRYRLVWSKMP